MVCSQSRACQGIPGRFGQNRLASEGLHSGIPPIDRLSGSALSLSASRLAGLLSFIHQHVWAVKSRKPLPEAETMCRVFLGKEWRKDSAAEPGPMIRANHISPELPSMACLLPSAGEPDTDCGHRRQACRHTPTPFSPHFARLQWRSAEALDGEAVSEGGGSTGSPGPSLRDSIIEIYIRDAPLRGRTAV
ncbi:hypothetical protein GQ53DRAFT_756211 [Thozetella sp. PMI_491]|nr:hypothetical protein GQ53DRAFT_756211 [Thozetella sp. PMI_491]